MISHHHKCIFIHIPKCAGTSFEELLGHLDDHDGRSGQDHRSIRMIQAPVPLVKATANIENVTDLVRRYREFFRSHTNQKNKFRVTAKQFDEYFKFTLVRNPWYRLHSWYCNVMRDEIHQRNYAIPPDISFEDFVIKFAGTGFLRPQTYWLKDFNGDINLDYIGKFEQLSEAFAVVSDKLKLEQAALPHRLPNKNRDFSADFTRKAVDYIATFYAEEIALFNYSFE